MAKLSLRGCGAARPAAVPVELARAIEAGVGVALEEAEVVGG